MGEYQVFRCSWPSTAIQLQPLVIGLTSPVPCASAAAGYERVEIAVRSDSPHIGAHAGRGVAVVVSLGEYRYAVSKVCSHTLNMQGHSYILTYLANQAVTFKQRHSPSSL